MPADRVVPVPVEIQEHAVESSAAQTLDAFAQRAEGRGPRAGDESQSGVAVDGKRISVPGGLPGAGDLAAGDADTMLLPHHFFAQDPKGYLVIWRREGVFEIAQVGSRRIDSEASGEALARSREL